ncbi:50S ribosomal protein L23 [Candidatus Roizmanbacteria bacterium RIFCSPLOWO2_02_FULL_37_19]|uniref:Large ribosomal subunit protein uL23 n=1 Tax=Candidatus Roizmanbacteria bacterium RIFCSPHIGHO2_02_FULL_37_24 TaxID=1802037 RepID=A0A1F7GWC2_9BACT|nr:MAG: 50S ribosomal protein L23 [Candidatus Roizmanbacteria bacterium RIFCSPHIGHO2_01_FULL_38_41]OGK23064.1 MAG: 50S ribosomal protein L23 [Candidatus Roizmanbacteria bacterium RIFCSPHIGHO2_02_FULL_37_24]OGK33409.1 MAG: 50S ribosomal protein L23 [Candidatus Roizmanbacteria bacterium RIFCSPHIGHO2_12_FULL_37_23]OGK43473.1 MAG: 50S ribosomal protein L23 [Candidatus Roizmanbacteria bacterium RIFCSPLOWO2_01_FULL_37_57]OGK54086.1 MAG: 50S ribosomal protein L23 [Candidatus Roizmanbacteria bacterium 
MRLHDVLRKPVITEKAIEQGKAQTYVFGVDPRANKHQIKVSVEKLFKVEVAHIRTHVKKGKMKRVGRKMKTKKMPDVKNAYVTLKKGKIDMIPSV